MYIGRLQGHLFGFDEEIANAKNAKSASMWWNNEWDGSMNIKQCGLLKDFMMNNHPRFTISDKCCEGAKKKTGDMADEKYRPDVKCIGIRQAEGGVRSLIYENCFSAPTQGKCAQYRPVFFFSDKDKSEYKEHYEIRYSDCYEVWGMKRTGCAGCPFNSHFEEDLEKIKKYEPKLYKAANAVFGESYAYTRAYRKFKKRYAGKVDGKACVQIGFDDLEGEKE
jgi:3'-phosphoadenosine 5'-phosphosulfate sulfotransferase (PAPS reductase)/FAD synthetase